MTASLLRTKHSHYYYNVVFDDGRIITPISTIPNRIVGSDSRTNIGGFRLNPKLHYAKTIAGVLRRSHIPACPRTNVLYVTFVNPLTRLS